MTKLDFSFPDHAFLMSCRLVRQINFRVQRLADSFRRSDRSGTLQKHHRQHHKRHQNLCHISSERRQVTDLHRAVQNLVSPKPHNGDDCHVHRKCHKRHLDDDDLKSIQTGLFQFFVGLRKPLFFIISPHKRFDDPNIGQNFLNIGIQFI